MDALRFSITVLRKRTQQPGATPPRDNGVPARSLLESRKAAMPDTQKSESSRLGPVDNWVAIRRVPCYLAAMHAGTAAQAREQVT